MLSVQNEISFGKYVNSFGIELLPEWENDCSDTAIWIPVASAHTSVSYKMEILNENNQVVRTNTGSKDDGLIFVEWDMKDQYGVPAEGTEFRARVTTSWSSPAARQTTEPSTAGETTQTSPAQKKRNLSDWPTEGHWIFAYQDAHKNLSDIGLLNAMFDGITSGIYDYSATGGPNGYQPWPMPIQNGRNAHKLRYGTKNDGLTPTRNNDWAILRGAIEDIGTNPQRSRNIWIFAHGSGSLMGGDWDNAQGTSSELDTFTSASGISTYKTYYPPYPPGNMPLPPVIVPTGITPKPYRFVFLHGCETGKGYWYHTFGIKKGERTIQEYLNTGGTEWRKRPSVMVSWTKKIVVANVAGSIVLPGFQNFREEFWSRWLGNPPDTPGLELKLAMERANRAVLDLGWYNTSYPGLYQVDWLWGLRYDGYTEMKYSYFNCRSLNVLMPCP
jgi:hypothetical protein